jgi:hypothetical protein
MVGRSRRAARAGLSALCDSMRLGLCGMLGVDETMGELPRGYHAPQPSAIGFRFEGENDRGDGLRRECFQRS